MKHIGTLPETNDILSPTTITLFGILSPPAEILSPPTECHFCLETITKGQFFVFNTECFKTWASASHTESTVRYAYCRTIYQYEDTCFLCLQEYTENAPQLYNVLPHKCSLRMHNRPHSSTLAPNLDNSLIVTSSGYALIGALVSPLWVHL